MMTPTLNDSRVDVRALLLVAALASALAFGPRLVGLFPLEHDVTEASSAGDDWLTYHRFALSAIDGGWTIPAVAGSYWRPGGFAYVYFVALIYSTFGVRSEAVYLIHGLLLVATIAGMALTFGPRLSAGAALLLTATLVVFLALDMFRATSFRLLSENLVVPLIALLLWMVLKATSSSRMAWFIGAGVASGLCALTRPNVVFFGPTIAALLAVYPWHPQPGLRRKTAAVFLAAFAVTAAIMPARNLVVSGDVGMMAALRPQGWRLPPTPAGGDATLVQTLTAVASFYAKRMAFTLGVPTWLEPSYRVRAHWLLMWWAFGLYFVGRQQQREFWEVLLLALLVVYLVPLVAVAHINSYGVRMLAPAVLFVLPLAVRGVEMATARTYERFG